MHDVVARTARSAAAARLLVDIVERLERVDLARHAVIELTFDGRKISARVTLALPAVVMPDAPRLTETVHQERV